MKDASSEGEVPHWVKRWEQLKVGVVVSAAIAALLMCIGMLLILPVLMASIYSTLYDWMGRAQPLPARTVILFGYLFIGGIIAYFAIEEKAAEYRSVGGDFSDRS